MFYYVKIHLSEDVKSLVLPYKYIFLHLLFERWVVCLEIQKVVDHLEKESGEEGRRRRRFSHLSHNPSPLNMSKAFARILKPLQSLLEIRTNISQDITNHSPHNAHPNIHPKPNSKAPLV